MPGSTQFPLETLSARLKFYFEARLIQTRRVMKDIEVALGEEAFANSHEQLRDDLVFHRRQVIRLERVVPYLVRRRDRERIQDDDHEHDD